MSETTILQTQKGMPSVFMPAHNAILQRTCASRHTAPGQVCGGNPGPSGECEACRQKRLAPQAPLIQAKLTIGQPNDPYEQEADRMADTVMRMPEPKVQRQTGEEEKKDDEEGMIQTKPIPYGHDVADQITSLVQRQVADEEKDEEEQAVQAQAVPNQVPEVTPAVEANINSMKGGGQPLDPATRAFMETHFGHDFSQVRVHTNARAAGSARAVNALAYTTGKDVVFGAGQYAPGTLQGQYLLAHELTHVMQQQMCPRSSDSPSRISDLGSPVKPEVDRLANQTPSEKFSADISVSPVVAPMIHRREFPDGTNDSLQPNDWLKSDRENANLRWQTANLYNLKNQRPHEYTQSHERRDFYLWVYNYTLKRGSKTRWPLAAYIVSGGAASLAKPPVFASVIENDVQILVRRGNQIIFDDSFRKLAGLVENPLKDEEEALAWDAQTLSEEQALIQTMYETTESKTVDQFGKYARQDGFLTNAGVALGWAQPDQPGKYHKVQDIPAFLGNIRNIDDRFAYGMRLADKFSKLPRSAGSVTRPSVSNRYTSGARFRQLDSRLGLHKLDAELDDVNVDEKKVIEIMQGLSPDEQQELAYNMERLEFLRNALNHSELEQALNGLNDVPEKVRDILL